MVICAAGMAAHLAGAFAANTTPVSYTHLISKISTAITKAFEATHMEYNPDIIDLLALRVTADYQDKIHDGKITVEDIQDSVEDILSKAG